MRTKGWFERQGKRPLGRPTRKREDIIKMNLKEIRWEGVI
jgi:hypothetical protein